MSAARGGNGSMFPVGGEQDLSASAALQKDSGRPPGRRLLKSAGMAAIKPGPGTPGGYGCSFNPLN